MRVCAVVLCASVLFAWGTTPEARASEECVEPACGVVGVWRLTGIVSHVRKHLDADPRHSAARKAIRKKLLRLEMTLRASPKLKNKLLGEIRRVSPDGTLARASVAFTTVLRVPSRPQDKKHKGNKLFFITVADLTLPSGGGEPALRLEMELRFEGREVTGYWEPRDETLLTPLPPTEERDEHTPRLSLIAGAFKGLKGPGKPVTFNRWDRLPCDTCCTILFRCGGMGPQGCNGSLMCFDACARKPTRQACLERDKYNLDPSEWVPENID